MVKAWTFLKDLEGELVLPSINHLDARAIHALEILDAYMPWLVGGSVRNALCGIPANGDFDIVVPDEYFHGALLRASSRLGEPLANRHGNPRFVISEKLTLDLWSPGRFFSGYTDVFSMLENFDYTCNSVAISRREGFVSTFSAVADIKKRILEPIAGRWAEQSPKEYAHLIGRGVNFVRKMNFRPAKNELFLRALQLMDADVLRNRYALESHTAFSVLATGESIAKG